MMAKTKRRFEKHDRLELLSDEQLQRAAKYGIVAELFVGHDSWAEFFNDADRERARELLRARGEER